MSECGTFSDLRCLDKNRLWALDTGIRTKKVIAFRCFSTIVGDNARSDAGGGICGL